MIQKRNRWLVNAVLIISVVALLGFSMVPLIQGVIQNNQNTTNGKPSPTQPAANSGPKKEELEARAKGYELVLQREPDNQTALKGLLEAKLGLGDVKGAIPPLEKLAKANPNEADYGVLLAQAKQQVGDLEGSAQAYRQLLQTKPGNINALSGFTNLLLSQKRPEAAIGLLQDSLKSAPTTGVDPVSVNVLLGDVYASQQRFNEALNSFDQAAQTNPQDFRPVLGKALVLQRQGKAGEAKVLFTQAGNMAPTQFKDQINRLAAAPASSPNSNTAPTKAPVPAKP